MRSAFLFVLIIIAFQTQSQKSQWYFELKGGFPLDVPMPLTFIRTGILISISILPDLLQSLL